MPGFSVRFWGVRGGYPVPGQETVEFGGNTTCVEVRAGSHLIIIDAGTGIVGLGEQLLAQWERDHQPLVGTMLFTHGHHDHTQGLAFFTPLRSNDSVFHVLGPRVFEQNLQDVLKRALTPSMFPVAQDRLPGLRSIRNVGSDSVIVLSEWGVPPAVRGSYDEVVDLPPDAVQVRVYHSSNHPKGGSLCYGVEYRGRRMVLATDTEGYEGGDRLLIAFARGADLLIHDAEYTEREYTGPPFVRQGWGHSTWRMAVEVGRQAGVKRLALTHHNSRHDDAFMRGIEQKAQSLLPSAVVAREGMIIEL
jgi:phosphoribosyl 1,2-cyclic phosphodiesterase